MPATSCRRAVLAAFVLILAACGTSPQKPSSPSQAPISSKYYSNDGPGDAPPANLDSIPDATPKLEPLHRFANRPYTVLGQDFVPAAQLRPYKEKGVASWYGRKFHGQKTAIGETYDMYAMTAAHPTLPLPSYAKVTNVATGKSVVVRVNDRGPFMYGRVIDLSYAAAHRIGIAQNGSGEVDVEAILPGTYAESAKAAQPPLPPVATAPAVTAPYTPPSTMASVVVNPDTPPLAAVSGGFSVQLGAFANFANAQAFLERTQNQLGAAEVEAKIRQAGGLYRVYIGPYPARNEAERVGERITAAFGFATTISAH